MRGLMIGVLLLWSSLAVADEGKMMVLKDGSQVMRIAVGSNRANMREMIERIRFLEQAVYELQNRVYELEHEERRAAKDEAPEWTCSATAMGEQYIGLGKTRAIAYKNVVDDCKAHQDPIFCNHVSCSK